MHPIKPYVERVTAQPKRKVDDTTGQIYYENSVKARSMLPSWMWKTRGRVDDPRVRKNKRLGAASLMDMALRSMARNMTRIDYEALRCIPSHIAMKLANLITSSETWSLETWETFVAAHPEAVPDMNYKLDIPDARGTNLCELPSLNKHLSNLTFDHVTRLSIVELAFTTDNLFEIAKIPNLEVLNLQGRVSGNSVDDSVYNDYFLSRWSYVVLGSGHLSKLRVLIFRHFDVTSATLKKLSPFPALALCNLESVCLKSDRNNTSRNGWEVIGEENAAVLDKVWREKHNTRTTRGILLYSRQVPKDDLPSSSDRNNSATRMPCISINYGPLNPRKRAVQGSKSIWYRKVPLEEKLGAELPAEGPVRKKIKRSAVGNIKRSAIGDILGSFN